MNVFLSRLLTGLTVLGLCAGTGGVALARPQSAARLLRGATSRARLATISVYQIALRQLYPGMTRPAAINMLSPTVLPDVALVNGHTDRFVLSQLRGSAVLLFFGARDCSSGCETVLAQFASVKRALADDARHVRFVMVGVDVYRDSAGSLLRHVRRYDDSFMALTGDEATILPFATNHGIWVDVRRASGKGGTDRLLPRGIYSLLIMPDGRWTTAFPYDLAPEDIADEIRAQLVAL